SKELKKVALSVGLIQNLAALRALVSGGLTQGHMRLHIRNFALNYGLEQDLEKLLIKKASSLLEKQGYILNSDVEALAIELKGTL
ncbi:MAG TPA: 3-hydroxy-3-methylglutaryl-CoA reductase, partial [Alphaproteobacteria bacterium]|nr:3-hydroxy-3-methylglutaryl-CoA reductase [Alphaproteobacteria bacterium]